MVEGKRGAVYPGAIMSKKRSNDRHTLGFDGGCNPNPGGEPRCGWVLRDPRGHVVLKGATVADPQYPRTNNTAEFFALLMGLRCSLYRSDVRKLTVQGDSRLAIGAAAWGWSMPKSPHLAELRGKILATVEAAGKPVRFRWVPRERNAEADALT